MINHRNDVSLSIANTTLLSPTNTPQSQSNGQLIFDQTLNLTPPYSPSSSNGASVRVSCTPQSTSSPFPSPASPQIGPNGTIVAPCGGEKHSHSTKQIISEQCVGSTTKSGHQIPRWAIGMSVCEVEIRIAIKEIQKMYKETQLELKRLDKQWKQKRKTDKFQESDPATSVKKSRTPEIVRDGCFSFHRCPFSY